MGFIVRHWSKERYLREHRALDADVVYEKEQAKVFPTREDAVDFLYTTTFCDKGFEIIYEAKL